MEVFFYSKQTCEKQCYLIGIFAKIMTDLLIGGNVQALTSNYTKQLSSFVNKLNQNTNILRKHSAELKLIATSLVTKSQQLQRIENIK